MRVRSRCAARFLLVLLAVLTVAPAGAQTPDPWTLWASPTRLRGANVYQRRVYPELDGLEFLGPGPAGPPYTQDDFDRLARLGANLVVLSHAGTFTVRPPYELDPGIAANLDRFVQMAARAGLYVVIALRSGPGRSEFSICCREEDWLPPEYLVETVWHDPAAQDGWVAMWRATAERYAGNPVVVGYDLMVEPNANDILDVWEPDAFYARYGGTLADWNQLFPRIVAAIREVDSQTPILVQPMGYGAIDWLPYLTVVGDPRIVYTVHQYDPHVYTHQEPPLVLSYPGVFDADFDGDPDTVDESWLQRLLAKVSAFAASHGVRTAVDEMGLMRWEPGGPDFLADEIALFEEQGMGWAVWVWETSYEPWTRSVHDFNFRFGTDPASRSDVPGNPMESVLTTAWTHNTARPRPARHAEGRTAPTPPSDPNHESPTP